MKSTTGAKMAALHLATKFLRSPETTASGGNYGRPISSLLKGKRPMSSSASSPDSTSSSDPGKPEIELEFIGPKARGDGSYPVERARAISGEKLLRNIMLDNKIELYATFRKVMNCGGRGLCGTCVVEILDGKDLLNERTNAEHRHLKKKPESWRLACQTRVGNKVNAGKIVVQRMPAFKE